jgi:CBS-domain-containing membrane protein
VQRAPIVVHPAATLREAADTMLREHIGRLPVLEEDRLVGIVTRSDLLEGHRPRIHGATHIERARRIRGFAMSPR